jgi:hypothetical protein
MLIVDIKDVRIAKIPDSQSPQGELSILYYLNDVYILLKQFPTRAIAQVQSFYQRMNEERGWQCLVLSWETDYSVWVSRSAITSNKNPPSSLTMVFGAQMYLLSRVSEEIAYLLGSAQRESFERSILAGIPTIGSLLELQQIMKIVGQDAQQSLQKYQPTDSQMQTLHQNLLVMSAEYLGKSYAAELIKDLRPQMPPALAKALTSWLRS